MLCMLYMFSPSPSSIYAKKLKCDDNDELHAFFDLDPYPHVVCRLGGGAFDLLSPHREEESRSFIHDVISSNN